MFFFDPSDKIIVKLSIFVYILLTTIRPTNGEKHRKIVGSVFEKISLEYRKISNFTYSLVGRFLKQFSTANLNNFERIDFAEILQIC